MYAEQPQKHGEISRYTKRVVINKSLNMFITHTDYEYFKM
jgi:hypothetical protein